jgi:hypothetical protein
MVLRRALSMGRTWPPDHLCTALPLADADKSVVTARYGDVAALDLPLDVYAELAAAFVLALAGALQVVGAFLPLYSTGDAAARCVRGEGGALPQAGVVR